MKDLLSWDPRPKKFRQTSEQQRIDFVTNVQSFELHGDPIPNFAYSVNFKYEDYELKVIRDESGVWDRKSVLENLVSQYIDNMKMSISSLVDIHGLSNELCVHVSDTIIQSRSETWKKLRRPRVTASFCLEFSKKPKNGINYCIKQCIENYWYQPPDLSNVTAIAYGSKNESKALEAFSKMYGEVKPCGLFISRKYPQLGASPDGIFEDFLLEVKCPLVLKDTTPTNISSLTPEQRKDFFLISSETSQDQVELKKNHRYYSQVQFQMYITGFRKSKFIV